jgi:hexulose-6-phosphate isomerase
VALFSKPGLFFNIAQPDKTHSMNTHKPHTGLTRRGFLSKSAQCTMAAAALPLMPGFAVAPGPRVRPAYKKSLKIGMVQEPLSVTDKFKLLKDLGFDGVEMDSPADMDWKAVRKASESTGLAIPGVVNSMHWKMPLSDPDPAVRKACVESMQVALRDCNYLGGTTVLLVPGVVNAKISYAEAWKRSQDAIRELLPFAREAGVKIAIENVWNNFLISPLEAARYIDELASEQVGWYFDVGNILRYGWPEHWIRTLGKRILKVDVKEFSRKKQDGEGLSKGFDVPLLEGDCNWPVVMQAFREIGYEGWFSAEVPGGDRKVLADISQRMDRIFAS